MQLPHFYEPSVLAVNATLILDEETSRHCVQVLRMKEGEKMQLANGRGDLYTAVIINANKKHCSVRTEEMRHERQAGRKVSIAISLLKNTNRFEWFVEKAAEIGVQEIVLLLCERTEKQRVKMERLQGIVVSAMLQSRQLWLPKLHQPATMIEAIHQSRSFSQKFIAHCNDDGKKVSLPDVSIQNSVQMLIGPEGDFTEEEIQMALQNGYEPVSLGATRLRTETAGVVASALLVHSHK